MSKAKANVKTVIAEVEDRTEYVAVSKCPYCKFHNETPDLDCDNITIMESCYNCNKKYKVKVPKNSI